VTKFKSQEKDLIQNFADIDLGENRRRGQDREVPLKYMEQLVSDSCSI